MSESQKIEQGSILKSSWGYDQTNIDFFEVVKVSNGWATIQKIGSSYFEDAGFLSETVMPAIDYKIGKPFRRKIHAFSSGDYVGITSYSGGSVWNGKPQLQSHTH
jgi:hypothetical protein